MIWSNLREHPLAPCVGARLRTDMTESLLKIAALWRNHTFDFSRYVEASLTT
jgi:hypothetical protein